MRVIKSININCEKVNGFWIVEMLVSGLSIRLARDNFRANAVVKAKSKLYKAINAIQKEGEK